MGSAAGSSKCGAGVQEVREGSRAAADMRLEATLASGSGEEGSVGTWLGGFILHRAFFPRQLTLLTSPQFPGSSGSLNICILKVNV